MHSYKKTRHWRGSDHGPSENGSSTIRSKDAGMTEDIQLAALAAGRLRHTGRPELTSAIRHGQQRRLGGATAWERRRRGRGRVPGAGRRGRGVGLDASPAKAHDRGFWAGQVIAGRSWPLFGSYPFTVTKGSGSETLECSNGTCLNCVIVAASALVRAQPPSQGPLAL